MALSENRVRRFKFNPHDRIVIDSAAYRAVDKDNRSHVLQLVSGDVIEKHFIVKTDEQIAALSRSGRLRCDNDYFSKTTAKLRARNDLHTLEHCSEKELRDIAWKKAWCDHFNYARCNPKDPKRPTMSLKSIADFIEREKGTLHRWYVRQYQEPRKCGRRRKGEFDIKEFDYPSASTLRNWLIRYRNFDERAAAFKTGYHRCGNRNQLHPEVRSIVEHCVKQYPSSKKPLMCDIYDQVDTRLYEINKRRPEGEKLSVSYKTVRRHIHKLAPFVVEAGRGGLNRALRKYAPVGMGLTDLKPLERVEIDDWEADLFTLLKEANVWQNLSPAERKKVPRVRCTVTAAIDVATRCIVGLNVAPVAPSTATAKSAVRRIPIDKGKLAKWAGASSDWNMSGPPELIATDGGPAFRGSFRDALARMQIDHMLPEDDPRKRGTIESFFRQLKKFCRLFTGQSFANVVERGDYPAEAMASLTYEDFYKLIVQFIVDIYHQRPHRGLGYRTPERKWQKMTRGNVAVNMSERALAVGLGLRMERVIDKHGVLVCGISYGSTTLSKLHGFMNHKPVNVFIDQSDVGQVFVQVPREYQDDLGESLDNGFLTVRAVDTRFKHRTLAEIVAANKKIRAFLKAEQQADRRIRLEAYSRLLEASSKKRREAGLNDDVLTEEQFKRLVKEHDRLGDAALVGPKYSPTPTKAPDEVGYKPGDQESEHSTTNPQGTSEEYAPKPSSKGKFGKSMDKFGEDE
ncbi:hypothetical protein [Roseibium alexandrii]|uniref:hypothetical protein n=1 Tax=Roseibium alexandrii TaxID=388408 RepID=UPI003752405F